MFEKFFAVGIMNQFNFENEARETGTERKKERWLVGGE